MSEPADRGPVDDDAEETDLVGRREAVKRFATHTAPGGGHARQRSRIRIGGLMSESSAEERTGTAKKPGESERLDNPPLPATTCLDHFLTRFEAGRHWRRPQPQT